MMEHPYRIHSSIGFGFLQLLMLSSLAYPTPPPPLYHNIALTRMMGAVYFTIFQDNPIYLKIECATILLEVIKDSLYIWYIIKDYTYIFGVFDIVSNLLFCAVIALSLNNGEEKWERINAHFEGIRKTIVNCCCHSKGINHDEPTAETRRTEYTPRELDVRGMYSSLPTTEPVRHLRQESPYTTTTIYSCGGGGDNTRKAFKPSFYCSPRHTTTTTTTIERNNIEHDGTTEYIRFDESIETPSSALSSGEYQYANILVSPYLMKDGTPITSFSDWTKKDTVGVCLFIYNLIQFIYQLMMYKSIIRNCHLYNAVGDNPIPAPAPAPAPAPTPTPTITNERLMRWLC
jgi:hypothetical protein